MLQRPHLPGGAQNTTSASDLSRHRERPTLPATGRNPSPRPLTLETRGFIRPPWRWGSTLPPLFFERRRDCEPVRSGTSPGTSGTHGGIGSPHCAVGRHQPGPPDGGRCRI